MSDKLWQSPASEATLRCSVIVPVYNGARVITCCLDALAQQTVPPDQYEIVVVDDGSDDATQAMVNAWAAQHRQIEICLVPQAHAGPAAARNRGAWAARAPYLLFTDADCRATPRWIEVLLRGFERPDAPAGLMGTYCSDQRALAGRFAQLEFEDRYQRMLRTPELDLVATYSAAFRRDVFIAAGGFDPSFPEANNEDVEFSYRLSEAGYVMRFIPEAQVVHRHASTWPGYARTKMGRGYWRMLVYRRHPSKALKDTYTPQVLKLQILLAPLVLVGVLLSLVRRNPGWLSLAVPFWLTTLPFAGFAARRDAAVAVIAPWGLWLRSVAFAIGVVRGVLAGARGRPEQVRHQGKEEVHR